MMIFVSAWEALPLAVAFGVVPIRELFNFNPHFVLPPHFSTSSYPSARDCQVMDAILSIVVWSLA